MTTGPEPRIRTEAGFAAGRGHRRRRAPAGAAATNRSKTASASSGPGRALGVVLDGLDRQLAVAQALDRAVVEVDLADPEAGPRRAATSPTTWTSWFWAVTWTSPSSRSWTGWFAPWWPNRRRRRVGARGPRHDLVAEADPEQRPAVVDDRRASATGPSSRAGSPGPGDRIDAVDVGRERRRRRRPCAGRTRTRAPRRRIARTMFALSPKSTIADQRAAVRRLARRRVIGRRRDLADEVLVLPARRRPRGRDGRVRDRSRRAR